jgi:hypothetical protein
MSSSTKTQQLKTSQTLMLRLKRSILRAFLILLVVLLGTFAMLGTVTAVQAAILAAVTISPTKTDAFIGGDGDGKADPGETIEYTVVIPNSGSTDATGVTYVDTIDPNTTLVGGSVAVSPVALADTFPVTVIGNIQIDSSNLASPFSVVANDYQGQNMSPAISISAYDATTTQGGQVVMTTSGANIGMFTYNPPPGYEGSDTFTYTLSDNTNAASASANRTATVTINVSGMIWFVNNGAPACTTLAAGCGRLTNPFNSLSAFNTLNTGVGNNPAANDNIFLYENASAYTGGVTLLAGQKLIGQDATQPLSAITGLTPPMGSLSLPAMNSGAPAAAVQNAAGDAITIGEGNILRGLTVSGTSGAGIKGVNKNALTVGTDVLTTGVSGADLDLSGGNGTVNFGASVTNTAGRAISIASRTGGTVSLTGAISDNGGTGVSLTSNTGATINFTGGLSLSTGANAAFTATGGGTVSATQNNTTIVNTLTTTTGTALNIANTTIGASGLTFRSISTNGASKGIVLDTTGSSGGLTVSGNGGTCTSVSTAGCSGGTIQNSSGGDDSSASPVGTGIVLNNTQNVSLTRMYIHDNTNYAIRGTNVTSFTLDNSVISGVNGNNGAGPYTDGSVKFDNLTGSATVSNAYFAGGYNDNFRVVNTTGTLNRITFTNVTFDVSGTTPNNDALSLEAQSGAVINITVQNSTFNSATGDLFQLNNNGTGTTDLVFSSNSLINNHPAIATGGGGVTINGGSGTFHIDNNTFRNAVGPAVLIVKTTDTNTLQGTFTGNTIGNAAAANSGSAEGDALKVQNAGGGTVTVAITNNQIHQYNNYGIDLLTGGGAAAQSGNFNAIVTGNVIDTPGNTASTISIPKSGIYLNGGTVSGDTYAICAQIGGVGALANSISTSGKDNPAPPDNDFRLRQRQATTVRLPGYGGANNDNTAAQNFIIANNSGDGAPVGLASNTVPTGGGFVGGGACAAPIAMLPSEQVVADANPAVETVASLPDVVANTNTALTSSTFLPASRRGNARLVAEPPANADPRALASGETVNVTIGTLPAGKSVTIKFHVTVNALSSGEIRTQLLNQGTVSFDPSQSALTTDPTPNADPFCVGTSPKTCTPVDRPDANVTSIARRTPPNTSTKATSVVWRVTFDAPVAGLTSSNFTLANTGLTTPSITGVSAVTGSPDTQWDVTVNTGTGDGTLGLNMTNDTGLSHDAFTLPFTGQVYTIDKTAPTITNVTSTSNTGCLLNAGVNYCNAGDVVSIQITFSEAVNVTGAPQLALNSGGTASYVSGTGTSALTFDYTVAAGQTASDLDYTSTGALTLNSGAIGDAAANNATLTLASPGAAGSLGANNNIVIDTTAPTATNFNRFNPATTPTNADTLIWQTIFSENVSGVDGADFTVPALTGETILTSGSADTYNVTVSGGDLANFNGSVDLDFAASPSIADLAGNPLTNTTVGFDQHYVMDNIAPTVTNVTSSTANGNYTTGATISIQVTFSENVDVSGTLQLTLETGTTDRTINYASGSGTTTLTFNYTVQAGDTSSDLDYVGAGSLALNSGTIQDAATNNATLTLPTPGAAGSLGANKAIIINTTAPTVVNVTSTLPNGIYGTSALIPVQVVFSEVITVTGTPQLTLETGATDRVAVYASGSGTNTLTFNYTTQLGDTSPDLDYLNANALNLNGGTIRDVVAIDATLTLPTPGAAGSLGANKNIVIDAVNPVVTNVTSTMTNGSYKAGSVIPIQITFSTVVTVTGTPQLTLETGVTDRVADYVSGSGSTTLTFNYTVQAADTSADLDYVGTAALGLNGSTIQDASLNNAILTLPTPGSAGSLGANKALVIDTTAPTVTNVSSSTANGSYTTGAVISIQITFSEVVNVSGTPQLTLETGTTDEVVNYSSGSGTNTLTFNYTVQAGDTSTDLDYVGATALALNSGTITDLATNAATLTLVTPGAAGSLGANKAIVIDTTAPTVTNVTSSTADGAYNVPDVISIQVAFNEVVNVTGTPQLTLETGTTDAVVNYTSGSGTNTLTFDYTVAAGHTSTDLDYVGTTSLALNGGTIRDVATNNAILTLATPGTTGSLGFNKAIVIDTTGPDTTITGNPATPTISASATFTFTGSDTGGSGVASFQCDIDGGGFSACTSPQSYTSLGNGSHTFQVRAVDNAGNVDSTPASYTWVVDAVAPDTTITANPANPTSSTAASFSFTGNDGSGVGGLTFQCKLDSGSFTTCTSPQAYTSLADGSHTFQVRAADSLGNTDATPASFTWVVDTTAPNTTITGNPANPTISASATFTFTGADTGGSGVASFQCQLDGGGFSACTTGVNYTGLSNGSHTFQVRAIDNVGLVDASPASYTWVVDTVAPNTNITSNPINPTTSITATFTFTGSDTGGSGVASFQCALDGGGFVACTSPQTYTGLANGSHTFQVRAVDIAGNVDTSPASFTWVVDAAAPDTTITANPSNPTNSTTGTFTFTGNDGSGVSGLTFACKLDSGSFAACTSPQSYTNLSDGSHTFQVRAADSLGNTDATPASYTWVVDTTAPTVISITSTATSPTNVSPIPVTITFSEPVCGFDSATGVDLNVTNGTTSALTSGSSGSTIYTFNLTPTAQGLVSLYLVSGSVYDGDCVTPLNHNSANSATFSITYDSVAPTVTINQAVGQADPTSASPVNFTVVFKEAVTGFATGDVTLSASTVSGTLTGVVTGGPITYTVAVSGMTGIGTVVASIPANAAQDAAGNNSAASTSTDNTVTIINQPPSLSNLAITSPINENGSTTLSGNLSGPEASDPFTLVVNWGDGSVMTYTYAAGTTSFSNPTHIYLDDNPTVTTSDHYTVTLQLNDGINTITDSTSVTVNNVAPTVNAGPDSTTLTVTPIVFNGSFTDPGSLDTHTIQWDFGDGSQATGTLTPSHAFTNAGIYTATLTVTDDDGGVGQDTLRVTVNAQANLSLTKVGPTETLFVGPSFGYTLTVANAGPDAATQVKVTDPLPAGLSFVAATSGCAYLSGTVTCQMGTLPNGGSATLHITVTANISGTFTNTASVSADQIDPNAANNQASASVKAVSSVLFYFEDFENPIGSEWCTNQVSTSPTGRSFLGELGNETTCLDLSNIPAHTYITLSFDLYIIRSWDGNQVDRLPVARFLDLSPDLIIGPDTWRLQANGNTLIQTTFSNWPFYMQAYPAWYPGGSNPPLTGASEVNTLGFVWGTEVRDSVYHLTFTFEHTGDTLQADFSALGLQALYDESWGLDNVSVAISGQSPTYRIFLPIIIR